MAGADESCSSSIVGGVGSANTAADFEPGINVGDRDSLGTEIIGDLNFELDIIVGPFSADEPSDNFSSKFPPARSNTYSPTSIAELTTATAERMRAILESLVRALRRKQANACNDIVTTRRSADGDCRPVGASYLIV